MDSSGVRLARLLTYSIVLSTRVYVTTSAVCPRPSPPPPRHPPRTRTRCPSWWLRRAWTWCACRSTSCRAATPAAWRRQWACWWVVGGACVCGTLCTRLAVHPPGCPRGPLAHVSTPCSALPPALCTMEPPLSTASACSPPNPRRLFAVLPTTTRCATLLCTLAFDPCISNKASPYRPQGWTHTWACSTAKLGYSGVSVATRQPPLSVTVGMGGAAEDEHEAEGRVVTVELPELFVVSCYVPNRCAPVLCIGNCCSAAWWTVGRLLRAQQVRACATLFHSRWCCGPWAGSKKGWKCATAMPLRGIGYMHAGTGTVGNTGPALLCHPAVGVMTSALPDQVACVFLACVRNRKQVMYGAQRAIARLFWCRTSLAHPFNTTAVPSAAARASSAWTTAPSAGTPRWPPTSPPWRRVASPWC